MRTAVKLVTLMNNLLVPMSARIPATQAANLIAYWKLGETSGTAAADSSATGANGAYAGTYTLGQPGIGDGSLSTSFAGGRVSLAATLASLDAVFNNAKGTIFLYAKVSSAGVWTDGVSRILFELGNNANNRVFINKAATNNTLAFFYNAGGISKAVVKSTYSPTTWITCAITWDKVADQMKAYLNGVQEQSTQTSLGTWSGALASGFSAIADFSSSGSANSWAGYLAQVAVWTTTLTAAEIAYLSPADFLM